MKHPLPPPPHALMQVLVGALGPPTPAPGTLAPRAERGVTQCLHRSQPALWDNTTPAHITPAPATPARLPA